MVDLAERLREQVAPIRVIDVGAMALGPTQYGRLLELQIAQVLGFEPQPDECDRLNKEARPGCSYLPYAIGDGTEKTFHLANANFTSSLYPPNLGLVDRFNVRGSSGPVVLGNLMRVAREWPVETKRLDDIPEALGTDYLKLDIQGAELDVLRGAKRVLEDVLVVETEIEFVPLYEGQPLFADIDVAMRNAGFLFHRFTDIKGATFRPLSARAPNPFRGQILWGDAVYVKDFRNLRSLGLQRILKLAVIMQQLYEANDFCLHALQVAEELGGPKVWDDLSSALTGGVKERPPLP